MLARIRKEFTVPYRAVTLLPNLTLAQLSSLVSEPDFPGQLFPVPVWKRVYPAGPLSPMLWDTWVRSRKANLRGTPGRLPGGDFVGKSGIEEYYESP